MIRLNLLVLLSLFPFSFSANIEILYSPDSIIFQNATNRPLLSSDLAKFLQLCLGYTTNKPTWNGFQGYKNIAKNIPRSVILFHSPISFETIAAHSYPFEIDSALDNEYVKAKNAMEIRNKNYLLSDFVKLFSSNKKETQTLATQLNSLDEYLNKLEPRNENQPVFLWFELFHEKNQLKNAENQNVEGKISKVVNQLKFLYGSNILIMSIYDENQMVLERELRQSKNTKDTGNKRYPNLAHDYGTDFHSSFITIGFASILFVLAVFVISVSMWNIDPGRDSIIYRLTSQKIKKDQ